MLTHDELERRRMFLTATDVAPIFGKSPWVGPRDVYLSKVCGKQSATNDAMEAGNLLEEPCLRWAEKQLGQILAGDWRVHENGINACSLDGVTADGEPVEAKTSGIVGPGSPHLWGEPMTDDVPDYYLLQAHAQMLVTGAQRVWMPALIGGRGFVMYVIHRSEAVCDGIARACERFWFDHVEARVEPEGDPPRLETLKQLRRVPNKIAVVDPFLVELYQQSQATLKEFQETADDCKRQLLASLGDAEAGEFPGGTVTYYEQQRKAYSVEASSHRVLRVKAEKSAKNKKGMVTA